MYPDFLIIGAQKSGTTWLHHNLQVHPQIWMPRREVHYFDRKIKDAESFDDLWYASLFEPGKGKTIGEYTPSYSVIDRDMVARAYELMPEAKIIFLMRNPIERAWSQSVMMKVKEEAGIKDKKVNDVSRQVHTKRRAKRLHKRFLKQLIRQFIRQFFNRFGRAPFQWFLTMVATIPEESLLRRFGGVLYRRLLIVVRRILKGSLIKRFGREKSLLRTNYVRTLENWGTYFPPEQIFVGFLEDVHFHPDAFLQSVHSFLGVDPSFRPPKTEEKINARSSDTMPKPVASHLAHTYRDSIRLLDESFGGYAAFWRYCAERLVEDPPPGESIAYPLWDSSLREDWAHSPGGTPEIFVQDNHIQSGPLSSISALR